ncbi:MAG: pyridoxal phosphate-dependent aminotransferase, partial [Prolixibacteraceae bacterium]|nr:pyridoxal phosphate-dependent aminotransferase [Prolixibacteraceae bacterium]
MLKRPFLDKKIVDEEIKKLHIQDPGNAVIREIVALVNAVEMETGVRYVRMEMGVPGLPAPQVGVEAEIEALNSGVASVYPLVDGIKPLKNEAARFVRNFMDVDISPRGCIPTVGSMQATYTAFMAAGNSHPVKNTILFIDPGFPVQKQQLVVMGVKYITFDVFNHRGVKLREKLEQYLEKGDICSIVYSNPNNPSWVCLTDDELQIIGTLADKYDVIIMEDLAYFGMDFRRDIHVPGQPPYQPTVAKYTDNYILFISASKIFSYAGQRCAIMFISDALFDREYPHFEKRFHCRTFGQAVV